MRVRAYECLRGCLWAGVRGPPTPGPGAEPRAPPAGSLLPAVLSSATSLGSWSWLSACKALWLVCM